MTFRMLPGLTLLLALGVTLGGCGSEPPAEEPAGAAPAAAPAASAAPRVFFVEPADGATVKTTVRLRFGIENYEIGAVPATVDKVRPGIGHHHVAVDTDCLPPGTVIEKAAPWVHFGDGKNEIDMQLPVGQHRLTLQLGDDAHMTMPGLCQTITVNVVE